MYEQVLIEAAARDYSRLHQDNPSIEDANAVCDSMNELERLSAQAINVLGKLVSTWRNKIKYYEV